MHTQLLCTRLSPGTACLGVRSPSFPNLMDGLVHSIEELIQVGQAARLLMAVATRRQREICYNICYQGYFRFEWAASSSIHGESELNEVVQEQGFLALRLRRLQKGLLRFFAESPSRLLSEQIIVDQFEIQAVIIQHIPNILFLGQYLGRCWSAFWSFLPCFQILHFAFCRHHQLIFLQQFPPFRFLHSPEVTNYLEVVVFCHFLKILLLDKIHLCPFLIITIIKHQKTTFKLFPLSKIGCLLCGIHF